MGKKMKPGMCALCLAPAMLQESHILPRFLWKNNGLIGDKKKFALVCHANPALTKLHEQDGPKEHLCCSPCEGTMGEWERYSRGILFGKNSPFHHEQPHSAGYLIDGIEYRRFKLYQLSVLWKMGASSLPYFSEVRLGKHQERLRKMVRTEQPGQPWQYFCLPSVLTFEGKRSKPIFTSPVQGVFDGRHAYSLAVGSVHLAFEVTVARNLKVPSELFISDGGTLFVPVRDVRAYPHVWKAYALSMESAKGVTPANAF
jgi:hypothetical protein